MNWRRLLLVITAIWLYGVWNGPLEWRMRHNFNQHFAAFEKLEQMQREDIHTYFVGHPENNAPHSGLTEERWAEYLKLLDEANIDFLLYTFTEPKKRRVEFLEAGANDWGYVYMKYPPPKFFNSFKECVPIMPSESCYILLRSNWYLFTEHARLEQTDAK